MRPLLILVGIAALAWVAPALAAGKPHDDKAPTAPVAVTARDRAEVARMDPLAQVAFWDKVLAADPRNVEAQVKLAGALRALGRYDEADAAVGQALVIEPDNVEALLEEARERIAAGHGFAAIEPAQQAERLAPHDWRAPSLLAIALEQDQRDDEALAAHRLALSLAPDNPAALTNLGMFEAAHGQPADAEALLRKAVSEPGATAQVRQDLALLLGLQGRLAEAEALERQDLPPAAVENNLAYFRAAAHGDPRTWASVQTSP
ncbi:MAG TPA: tetratricopeptide repeat protein [Caulobacteraceae bacterium]|nr:tetratricopeptide repeat protein [Caulobacteraceae bacterium]